MVDTWMVRTEGGKFVDDFVDNGYVGIGLGATAKVDLSQTESRDSVAEAIRKAGYTDATNAVSQLHRVRTVIPNGARVITYDRSQREYVVGVVTGPYRYSPDRKYPHQRPVKWVGRVKRDDLDSAALGKLGSLLTVFQLHVIAASQIDAILRGETPQPIPSAVDVEESETDAREEIAERARELVKDRVAKLSWQQMQELVAGILRAMGYKTRISPSGPDRGKDIIASPDGLGLQDPRISAEVKHREGSMGAPVVRSFLAGLGDSDRGLYISTGGFTKEAYYEAERAKVPVTLLDLDDLVELLIEHYDNVDKETTALIPLRPVYWPVD